MVSGYNLMSSVAVVLVVASALALGAVRARGRREHKPSTPKSKLVFLGSGDSAGTPILFCLLGLIPGRPEHGCHVCNAARADDQSKHKRRNPCVLLQSPNGEFNVLIDCGKTFRDAAAQFFPKHKVNGISAVLLTHEHADATFGLDELRTVQRINAPPPPKPRLTVQEYADVNSQYINDVVARVSVVKLPEQMADREFELATVKPHPLGAMYEGVVIHCMERTKNAVAKQFPYLVSKGVGNVPRFVSQLDFQTFDFASKFEIANYFSPGVGLEVEPLLLIHGANYECAGFLFGDKDKVAYLSDVSWVPVETKARLETVGELALLVLDALRPLSHDKHERPQVHFDLEDALEFLKALKRKPKLTLLTGLGHEFDYFTTNAMLAKLNERDFGTVQCAYDGMELNLDL